MCHAVGECQRRCSQEVDLDVNKLTFAHTWDSNRTELVACGTGLRKFLHSRYPGRRSFQLRQPCPGCPLGSLWPNLPPHGPTFWDTGTTGPFSPQSQPPLPFGLRCFRRSTRTRQMTDFSTFSKRFVGVRAVCGSVVSVSTSWTCLLHLIVTFSIFFRSLAALVWCSFAHVSNVHRSLLCPSRGDRSRDRNNFAFEFVHFSRPCHCPVGRVAVSPSQVVIRSVVSPSVRRTNPAKRARQPPSLARCTMFRVAPFADHEHHPMDLQGRGWDRRSCFRSSHHQLLQSWHRCASGTLHSCRHALSTRVAWAFPTAVCPPTPVVCDPRCGARSSCLSAASSLAACCLPLTNSVCTFLPGQTAQRSSVVVQKCRERGAFQTIQLVPFANRMNSATMTNEPPRGITISPFSIFQSQCACHGARSRTPSTLKAE